MPPLDFVMPSEVALIQADAHGVVADPQLGVSITYRSYQSRTFTPSTGVWTPTYADQSTIVDGSPLRAIRSLINAREAAASQGIYQAGDVRYLITRADLLTVPGTDDRVVEGAYTYDMVDWQSDPVSAFWRLVMRRVK